MGYTHYWEYKPNNMENSDELRSKFSKATSRIKKIHSFLKKNPFIHKGNAGGYYDKNPCVLRGGFGTGKPVINESELWFNGDAKSQTDHETFHIVWFEQKEFNFCKTARKPYDLMVSLCLLVLKDTFNDKDVFSFSSDGDEKDWELANKVYAYMKNRQFKNLSEKELKEYIDGEGTNLFVAA